MICDEVAECNYSDGRKEANARFIAFARAWVPEAAAALTALSAEAAALKAQVAEAVAQERERCISRVRDNWVAGTKTTLGEALAAIRKGGDA
jgi:hypothetical protein